jgi:hypothetical protein
VGYCGDNDVVCWLDTRSVKNALTGSGYEDATLAEIENISLDNMESEGYYGNLKASTYIKVLKEVFDNLKNKITLGSATVTKLVDPIVPSTETRKNFADKEYTGKTIQKNLKDEVSKLSEKIIYNNQKADLALWEAGVYDAAARVLGVVESQKVDDEEKDDGSGDSDTVTPTLIDDTYTIGTDNYIYKNGAKTNFFIEEDKILLGSETFFILRNNFIIENLLAFAITVENNEIYSYLSQSSISENSILELKKQVGTVSNKYTYKINSEYVYVKNEKNEIKLPIRVSLEGANVKTLIYTETGKTIGIILEEVIYIGDSSQLKNAQLPDGTYLTYVQELQGATVESDGDIILNTT